MDPITMMVASIGMQFFNNYANSKKNEEIQEKQREFQRAAAEHDFERMRKLQAESAKLALELEAEVHKERVEDINNNYDTLLDNFAHSFAIQNWPLNVLPFVMKGESFGTLFNGTTQSVNLHCILTPSNCEWFNREFYDDIDLRLEAEMNNKWNAQTTHPVVYYGGAWNRRSMNRGISVPNVVDLDDIELLRVKLKDVPVVVITPYFDPWLHFKVKLWGMGKDSEAPYRIDIPHGNDIEYSQRIFSYDYHKDQTELTEDFENTTIEEFVPYLECLIGFIADKYFWSMYRVLPVLHKRDVVNGLAKIVSDNNINNFINYTNDVRFDIDKSINYLCAIQNTVSNNEFEVLQKYQIKAIRNKGNITVGDIRHISNFASQVNNKEEYDTLIGGFSERKYEEMEIIECVNPQFDNIIALVEELKREALYPRYFIFCKWNADVVIGTFCTEEIEECIYENSNTILYFAILGKELNNVILDRNENQFYSIDIENNYKLNLFDMKQTDRKRLSLRERVARKLEENAKRLRGYRESNPQVEDVSDPWSDNTSKERTNELENILSYFVQGVNKGQIPFKKMGNCMSMSHVLNWLDTIDDNSVNGQNQVYVIRGVYEEKNKVLYCVFLAHNDYFLLNDTSKYCFICDTEPEEMVQLFNGKSIYVIPFEN